MARLRFRRASREQYSIEEGRLADQPTRKDALGYQKLAEWTAKHVLEPKVTPITIGVYGPWGIGKTSFLSMVPST
jgi:KAP family P-loop domain